MAEVFLTAGKNPFGSLPLEDPKKDAIQAVRRILRNPQSTDDQVDDALEALIELTKE